MLNKFLQLSLSDFHAIIVEVILQFLRIENVEPVLLVVSHGSSWRHSWVGLILASTWWLLALVRVCRRSVTRSILVLRIGPVSLIGISPLILILVFEHRLDIFSHGLSELPVGVQRCTVACVELSVLVIDVHAPSA